MKLNRRLVVLLAASGLALSASASSARACGTVTIDVEGITDPTKKTNPGGFVELQGNLLTLTLSQENLEGDEEFRLQFEEGQDYAKVWENGDKTGWCFGEGGASYHDFSFNEFPVDVHVEGVAASSDRAVELNLYVKDKTHVNDTARLTVNYLVTSVEWKRYEDNDTTNAGLTTCPNNGGKRIYPGWYSYVDGYGHLRYFVFAEATISPSAAAVTVYFKSFDVDDPSPNATIDTNGSAGDDNHGTPKAGTFIGDPHAPTSISGEDAIATCTLGVTQRPGDNFMMLASTCPTVLESVTQGDVDGGEIPHGVEKSEMLTVWRKLHLELDSMEAGVDGQYGPEEIDDVDFNDPHAGESRCEMCDWHDDDGARFEGGTLKVTGGPEFEIIDHEDVFWDDDCIVDGDVRPHEGSDATLTDDDGSELPRKANWGILDAKLAPAYVEAAEESGVSDLDATFEPNLDDDDSAVAALGAEVASGRVTSDVYWMVQIISCHQGEEDWDGDPDLLYHFHSPADYKEGDQSVLLGQTPRIAAEGGSDDNICCVALETCRDHSDQLTFLHSLGLPYTPRTTAEIESITLVHEVGWVFGCESAPTGSWVMSNGVTDPSVVFRPDSIKRIRSLNSIYAP